MANILTVTPNPALDLTAEIPGLALGAVNRSEATQLQPAGKGINVARVLAQLGHTVTVSGFMAESNAAPFERLFEAEALRDRFVRVLGCNRINIKIAETGGRVTDINGPGFTLPPQAIEQLKADLGALVKDVDAVVFAGSLPPGLPAQALYELMVDCQRIGRPTWLDTSGSALVEGLKAIPRGVKPNGDELSTWSGRPLSDRTAHIRAAREMKGAGIREVIVSMGAEGVFWLSPDLELYATSPPVPVVSTVCAGDTLLAGIIHGQLSGLPRTDTLQLATALAAESVRHVGVGNPDAPDLSRLKQQTRIHSLLGDNTIRELPL
ncbi:1-phosphofructokinase [Marinobacter caseinilyticus]|uniref:1-phosphofructokinase n=1 Tax=Marinobacter caseinilyticus TaxID=2692195 RepID=UPI00140BDD30|nr:1-phosphofructokinase [Marinobacter caseinilyticus]